MLSLVSNLLWLSWAVVSLQQQSAAAPKLKESRPSGAIAARVQTAETALEKGDYPAAVTQLKLLAADKPHDVQILYDLGYAEERTGDDAGAALAYADALVASPDAPEPKLALGLLDARAGRTDKARGELLELAGRSEKTPEVEARALRALAAIDEQARPDAAREELLRAIQLTGENADDASLSARLAAQAGDPADAEKAYRRALAANPNDVDTAVSFASLLSRDERSAEAETILEGARTLHPGDPRLVSQLAAIYGREGKVEEAVSLLQELRKTDPAFASNAASTRMLARLEVLSGNDADAAVLYADLVHSGSTDPMLLDEYGGTLVKLARFAEAEAVFSKALAMKASFLTPEDWAETASHLAFAASRNHQPEVALQALAFRATVLPNSPSSLFLEAISYDALRKNGEAVMAYRSFLAVAGGKFPDQEFQARHRLVALEHKK